MKSAVIPFLFLATLILGCSSTRSARVEIGPETGSDAAIESKLELFDPRTVVEGNAKRMELTLHNKTQERLDFLFTADWIDQNGHPVPLSPRQWTRATLDGGATRAVRLDDMPLQATSFKLRYASTERR